MDTAMPFNPSQVGRTVMKTFAKPNVSELLYIRISAYIKDNAMRQYRLDQLFKAVSDPTRLRLPNRIHWI
jgi:hypothetical protein